MASTSAGGSFLGRGRRRGGGGNGGNEDKRKTPDQRHKEECIRISERRGLPPSGFRQELGGDLLALDHRIAAAGTEDVGGRRHPVLHHLARAAQVIEQTRGVHRLA